MFRERHEITARLNALADRVKHDACEFKKICGDKFVFQTEEGVKVLVAIQISFSSNDQHEEFKRDFKAGIEGAINKTFNLPGPCCTKIPLPVNISFSGDFNNSLERITSNLRQQGRIEIFALQTGGDVAQLGGALGANGALGSCSLDNRAACLQMVDNALAYLATPAFIDGVKNDPGVLNYAERPYWEVDPEVPNLATEITPEIENARLQLATEFDNRLADQTTLQSTLALSLSSARQQQLRQLQTALATETQALYQAGLLCFSDLVNCPQKAAQVLAGLKAYDRAAINPNPADGLVAYYPFNANALDESGNGNNGTVYGASLTADRNGKVNSAYNFNGANYIKVDNSNGIQFSSITAVAWINPSNITNGHHEIIRRDTGNGAFLFAFQYGTQLTFGVNNTPVSESDTPIIANSFVDGSWHLVVGSYNGNEFRVYADGQLIGSKQHSTILNQGSNGPVFIGSAGLGEYFDGKIDDIRIYNRALTEAEIKQLYETTESKINQAPLAQFTASSIQGAAPLTVNLDASASSDADGTLSRYDWLSSDGQTKSGKTASFTFANAGEYDIILTVKDDQNATSEAKKAIRVTGGGGTGIVSCTSATISDCRASYSFDGKVCAPCVVVPGAFGTSQIFAVEMQQKPFSLAFEVNPLTLKQHTFKDSCAANYSPMTGVLNLPCVSVGADNYNVDMQQRPGGLIFDVTGVR